MYIYIYTDTCIYIYIHTYTYIYMLVSNTNKSSGLFILISLPPYNDHHAKYPNSIYCIEQTEVMVLDIKYF